MISNIMIGQRLEARRLSLGYTMEFVAEKIGVTKSTIQRYEKGKIQKLKIPVIESYCNVLGINPNWLIGISPDMEKSPDTISDDGGRRWAIAQIDQLTDEEFAVVAAYLKAIAKEGEKK